MKKLNTTLTMLGIVGLILGAGIIIGCEHTHSQQSSGAKPEVYTCRMHPEIVQKSPGTCPKCGMELSPKD